jgi:hypothetical protein
MAVPRSLCPVPWKSKPGLLFQCDRKVGFSPALTPAWEDTRILEALSMQIVGVSISGGYFLFVRSGYGSTMPILIA